MPAAPARAGRFVEDGYASPRMDPPAGLGQPGGAHPEPGAGGPGTAGGAASRAGTRRCSTARSSPTCSSSPPCRATPHGADLGRPARPPMEHAQLRRRAPRSAQRAGTVRGRRRGDRDPGAARPGRRPRWRAASLVDRASRRSLVYGVPAAQPVSIRPSASSACWTAGSRVQPPGAPGHGRHRPAGHRPDRAVADARPARKPTPWHRPDPGAAERPDRRSRPGPDAALVELSACAAPARGWSSTCCAATRWRCCST